MIRINTAYVSVLLKEMPAVWNQTWFILMIMSFTVVIILLYTRIVKRNRKLILLNQSLLYANAEIKECQEEITLQNEELSKNHDYLETIVEQRTSQLHTAKMKAEESDKLKTAFLANMSHEIRTPMNAIVGFSSLLDSDQVDVDVWRTYVKIITKNSESLLVLINDIIDLSLIDANQLMICKTSTDVNSLFVELESYHQLEAKKDVNVSMVKENMGNSLEINTDPVRLKQVISNLLNNAVKFTEQGNVKFGYNIIGQQIRFFVSDTGIGIAKDNYEKIFHRFHKIEEDKIKVHRGAGMGLAICKNIVELMGGEIWLNSEVGKGTTFYVDLPFVQEKNVHNEGSKKESQYNWANKVILVAEDEATNYQLIERILAPTKAMVVWAENGQKAVDYIFQNPEHNNLLVLMDIKMPVMNGIDALKMIHKINKKIPIIAVTAYAYKKDKQEILENNFADYITKPIDIETFLECIDRHL